MAKSTLQTILDEWLTIAILIGITGCTVSNVVETVQSGKRCELHDAYQENFKATLDLIEKRSERELETLKLINERMEQSQ